MVPARKGCESRKSGRGWFYGNQVPFSPKEDLMQGKVEQAPRLPKGINTPPWAPKEGWSIHSSKSRRDEGVAPGGSWRPLRVLELPRRWLRPCPSRHGWTCVVKPWWSSGAVTWIRQVVCTFNIRWCNYILSYFDLLRVMLIHMCSYHAFIRTRSNHGD
jgi:hypothetical protein